MIDTATPSYTSFNGHKRIASGSLPINALAVKHGAAKFRQQPSAWTTDVRDDARYLAYPLPLVEVPSLAQ
ncbi:hypothetical protein [Ottowia thiooxydans]|uniref:Transposase n=1 Tax=Ottowia thiooxydans TaxID=219182 RepID=A0ABV2QCY5_9BURK